MYTTANSTDPLTYLTGLSHLANWAQIYPLSNLFPSVLPISVNSHSLLPAVQAKSGVTLDQDFFLSFHVQSISKSYWLHLLNISRIPPFALLPLWSKPPSPLSCITARASLPPSLHFQYSCQSDLIKTYVRVFIQYLPSKYLKLI